MSKPTVSLAVSTVLCDTPTMFEQQAASVFACKVIPLAQTESTANAVALANVLCDCGMTSIELAFRTQEGDEGLTQIAHCIEAAKRACPTLLVGAGTVTSVQTASLAKSAGADFAVTPGFSPSVVDWCVEHNLAIVPGVCTPGEIQQALERGLHLLKFFPAEAMGGVRFLDAMKGPFASVAFFPTGGITQANAATYLALSNVAAVGGSWMCPKKLIDSNDWQEISRLCLAATALVH